VKLGNQNRPGTTTYASASPIRPATKLSINAGMAFRLINTPSTPVSPTVAHAAMRMRTMGITATRARVVSDMEERRLAVGD
jgi:hypothetical protein